MPLEQLRVCAAVSEDNVAGGGGQPVREQGTHGLGDGCRVLHVPADRGTLVPTIFEHAHLLAGLLAQRAADGIWYRSSTHELRGRGALATWTSDGRPATECRAID